MDKQGCQNIIQAREYRGGFHDPFMVADVKHSLMVEVRQTGDLALMIYFKTVKGSQGMQGVMLTNEQRLNLGAFLLEYKPELWTDMAGAKEGAWEGCKAK